MENLVSYLLELLLKRHCITLYFVKVSKCRQLTLAHASSRSSALLSRTVFRPPFILKSINLGYISYSSSAIVLVKVVPRRTGN